MQENRLSIYITITLAIPLLLSLYLSAYGSGACGEDCMKCHNISTNEVLEIFKAVKITDAKVINIQMSPVRGLWEVSLEKDGKKGILYIDFSKNYVMLGPIVEVKTGIDKTREKLLPSPVNLIPYSKIPLKDALILGEDKAEKKVIVFTDTDCPFCAKLHNELKKIVAKRKDIAFYIKLFPLPFHKDAYWKSKTILCERSLRLLDDAYEGKQIPKPRCEAKEIDENIRLASELGITGTPTIILPDGRVFVGFLTEERLRALIDSK